MIFPQVGSSETDAVWVYTLTYGGGIVSVCALHVLFFFPFPIYCVYFCFVHDCLFSCGL